MFWPFFETLGQSEALWRIPEEKTDSAFREANVNFPWRLDFPWIDYLTKDNPLSTWCGRPDKKLGLHGRDIIIVIEQPWLSLVTAARLAVSNHRPCQPCVDSVDRLDAVDRTVYDSSR